MSSRESTAGSRPAVRYPNAGRRGITVGRVILYAVLTFLSITFLLPFYWLVATSLKTPSQIFTSEWIPNPIRFQNYVDVFEQTDFLRWTLNTAFVTTLAIIAVALSSAIVAYPFAKLNFPFKRPLFALVLATMMLPGVVMMVPVFLIWRQFGAINTYYPLWVPNLFGSAFYIFMLRQFFMTIPNDLKEAGLVDGASHFRIFWSIMLPLVRPAIVTVLLFEFVAKWDDYLTPLIYLNDPNKYTLAVGLASFLKAPGLESRWDLWMAGSVLVMLPVLILFFLAQRHFIEGISAGAVKG